MEMQVISKETFKELPSENKLDVIYDCMFDMCNRLSVLEGRRVGTRGLIGIVCSSAIFTGGVMQLLFRYMPDLFK
jgi:hypothetical protein